MEFSSSRLGRNYSSSPSTQRNFYSSSLSRKIKIPSRSKYKFANGTKVVCMIIRHPSINLLFMVSVGCLVGIFMLLGQGLSVGQLLWGACLAGISALLFLYLIIYQKTCKTVIDGNKKTVKIIIGRWNLFKLAEHNFNAEDIILSVERTSCGGKAGSKTTFSWQIFLYLKKDNTKNTMFVIAESYFRKPIVKIAEAIKSLLGCELRIA